MKLHSPRAHRGEGNKAMALEIEQLTADFQGLQCEPFFSYSILN